MRTVYSNSENSLLVEGALKVLPAIKDTKDSDYLACYLEGDRNPPSKTEDAQAGPDVVSPRTAEG
jgi:hypothetical protein